MRRREHLRLQPRPLATFRFPVLQHVVRPHAATLDAQPLGTISQDLTPGAITVSAVVAFTPLVVESKEVEHWFIN